MKRFVGDEVFQPQHPPAVGRVTGTVVQIVGVQEPEQEAEAEPEGELDPPHSRDRRPGYQQDASTIVMFMLAGAMLVVMTVVFFSDGVNLTGIVLGLFSALWWLFIASSILERLQSRRVASVMAQARPAKQAAVPVPSAAPDAATLAPPLDVRVHLQLELPPLHQGYQAPVTATANVLGLPPRPVLYLYNFYSFRAVMRKAEGDWRRFGPLWFLGSPADIAQVNRFTIDIQSAVDAQVIADPAAFDARYAAAASAPMPPGDADLKSVAHFSGGYPQTMFLCSDAAWKHAANRLFADAGHVLLDASDYDTERAGLNWEISQIVDLVDVSRLIVLVDAATDQVALCAAFRSAWSRMAASSPNNRPDAAPVQWVRITEYSPEGYQAPSASPPGPSADPEGRFPRMPWLARRLLHLNHERALDGDRIYGLLLDAGAN